MHIVPFRAEHVEALDAQDHSKGLQRFITARSVLGLEGPYAYTALVDGRVMACAGVMPLWEGCGEAWSYLAWDCGKHFIRITRAALRFFEAAPFDRIQAVVEVSFPEGHRWVNLMGFALEAPRLRRYVDGKDYALYARVKHG